MKCKCGNEMEYWDETDEETVYLCQKCKKFASIPFDTTKLNMYFE